MEEENKPEGFFRGACDRQVKPHPWKTELEKTNLCVLFQSVGKKLEATSSFGSLSVFQKYIFYHKNELKFRLDVKLLLLGMISCANEKRSGYSCDILKFNFQHDSLSV